MRITVEPLNRPIAPNVVVGVATPPISAILKDNYGCDNGKRYRECICSPLAEICLAH